MSMEEVAAGMDEARAALSIALRSATVEQRTATDAQATITEMRDHIRTAAYLAGGLVDRLSWQHGHNVEDPLAIATSAYAYTLQGSKEQPTFASGIAAATHCLEVRADVAGEAFNELKRMQRDFARCVSVIGALIRPSFSSVADQYSKAGDAIGLVLDTDAAYREQHQLPPGQPAQLRSKRL
jgi:hypothetical protein